MLMRLTEIIKTRMCNKCKTEIYKKCFAYPHNPVYREFYHENCVKRIKLMQVSPQTEVWDVELK